MIHENLANPNVRLRWLKHVIVINMFWPYIFMVQRLRPLKSNTGRRNLRKKQNFPHLLGTRDSILLYFWILIFSKHFRSGVFLWSSVMEPNVKFSHWTPNSLALPLQMCQKCGSVRLAPRSIVIHECANRGRHCLFYGTNSLTFVAAVFYSSLKSKSL